ncbi:hypothetical protein MCHI_002241 [Candidatus Magnetoovum chiemensis]|nr:hypothetical protein MCHI_002241 [Candidatus Magnetoovum chiemensis]
MIKLLRNINILNITLLIAIAGLSYWGYKYYKTNLTVDLSGKNSSVSASEATNLEERNKLLSKGDYSLIIEKNLFHPDRKFIKPAVEAQPQTASDVPLPEFIVYGTIVSNELNVAYVVDKKTPYGTDGTRGERQRTLRLGDDLDGYVLNKITHDGVEFVRDGKSLTFDIINKDKNKDRKIAPIEPTSPSKSTKTANNPSDKELPKDPKERARILEDVFLKHKMQQDNK